MLIQLNRFLTANEVKKLYQFPDDLFEKVLPHLPVAHVAHDGTPQYQEMIVDEFLQYVGTNLKFSDATDSDLQAAATHVVGQKPKPTEIVWPDHVRIDGNKYGPFSPLAIRMLDVLLGKGAVEIGDVIEHMYGHDAGPKENAAKQVVKRLNQTLADQNCPSLIESSNGHFAIR